MSDPTDPLSWVAHVEEDYAVARSALRRKPAFTYTACFHAQQSAEKYLKALLVAKGHPFSRVHDLLILNDECVRSGIFVDVSEDQLSSLSHYAVLVRYPGDDPTPEETRRAVEIAKFVRRFVRKWLGLSK